LLSSVGEAGNIKSAGVTGSGRQLIGSLLKANIVKNEITAHLTGTLLYHPDAATIIEIGGQDSKIIIIENGIPVDFGMSGVCGSGTGTFLEQQAARFDVDLSDFGSLVNESDQDKSGPCHFGGGCGIFIESAMIRCQQMGVPLPRIISGLCDSVVTNYLFDTARGKKIKEPIYFQGGVASNEGILHSFEKRLGMRVIVPENHIYMGAIGVASSAKEKQMQTGSSDLNIQKVLTSEYQIKEYICEECEKDCQITEITSDGCPTTTLGRRCDGTF
jgi:predicted CoA-substrate-specific enzyme activase